MVWVLFAAYGIFYGLSDGIFRAYVANIFLFSLMVTKKPKKA